MVIGATDEDLSLCFYARSPMREPWEENSSARLHLLRVGLLPKQVRSPMPSSPYEFGSTVEAETQDLDLTVTVKRLGTSPDEGVLDLSYMDNRPLSQ
jgi:hypothetical protein